MKLQCNLFNFNKCFLILLVVIVSITSSGCWNRRELNTMGIVGTMGLDVEGDKIKITMEVMKPAAGKAGSKAEGAAATTVSYVQGTGDSVFDAIRNVTTKYDRKLFLSHIKFYIFGEEAAKKGLLNYLDWYQRDHEPRRTGYIVIAKGSTAENLMGINGGIEATSTDYLEKIVELKGANAKVIGANLVEFLKNYYSSGIQPIAGIITRVPKVQIKPKDVTLSPSEISAEGAAVFIEGRLVGFLNGTDTKGLNFVTNKVKSGIIANRTSEKDAITSVEIIKSKTRNSVKMSNQGIKLFVNVEINAMLGEENGNINLKDQKVIKKLEQVSAQKVKENIEASISKVQNDFKSDIFGFGQIVHAKYPYEWKKLKNNWDEEFSKAAIEVSVNCKINRTGLVDLPVESKED